MRKRLDDLEALVLAFAKRYSSVYGSIATADGDLVSLLRSQTFSGNIRELENTVLRMLFAKSDGDSLGVVDWLGQRDEIHSDERRDPVAEAAERVWEAIHERGLSYADTIRALEKHVIQKALLIGGATRREVANHLRTSERTLYHKMRLHQLHGRPGTC